MSLYYFLSQGTVVGDECRARSQLKWLGEHDRLWVLDMVSSVHLKGLERLSRRKNLEDKTRFDYGKHCIILRDLLSQMSIC